MNAAMKTNQNKATASKDNSASRQNTIQYLLYAGVCHDLGGEGVCSRSDDSSMFAKFQSLFAFADGGIAPGNP